MKTFRLLEKSGKPLGNGGIACLYDDFLPFNKDNAMIPIRLYFLCQKNSGRSKRYSMKNTLKMDFLTELVMINIRLWNKIKDDYSKMLIALDTSGRLP